MTESDCDYNLVEKSDSLFTFQELNPFKKTGSISSLR